jgi:hypothetical protein
MRRKNADVEAEYNAVTCVAVYMLLMSFSQKGIDKLRNHQEHMKMRHPNEEFVVSEGFDDGEREICLFLWFGHLIVISVGVVQEPFCEMQRTGGNGQDMVACATGWSKELARSTCV